MKNFNYGSWTVDTFFKEFCTITKNSNIDAVACCKDPHFSLEKVPMLRISILQGISGIHLSCSTLFCSDQLFFLLDKSNILVLNNVPKNDAFVCRIKRIA